MLVAVQILFFTASWCQPCRAVDGVLDRLSRTYGRQLEIARIDFDAAAAENARWNVREIPVVIALSEGKVAWRLDGAAAPDLAALETALEKLLRKPELHTLEAVGAAEAPPDRFHVMMKLEYAAARAVDAAALGEKRLEELLKAVNDLKLPNLTWRITNNVFGEPSYNDRTISYARNVVFTAAAPPEERDRMVARLEDLGARYNSHCVTCIGSG